MLQLAGNNINATVYRDSLVSYCLCPMKVHQNCASVHRNMYMFGNVERGCNLCVHINLNSQIYTEKEMYVAGTWYRVLQLYPLILPHYPLILPHYPLILPHYPLILPHYPLILPHYPLILPHYPLVLPRYPLILPHYRSKPHEVNKCVAQYYCIPTWC
jgi:hypothetical protein